MLNQRRLIPLFHLKWLDEVAHLELEYQAACQHKVTESSSLLTPPRSISTSSKCLASGSGWHCYVPMLLWAFVIQWQHVVLLFKSWFLGR